MGMGLKGHSQLHPEHSSCNVNEIPEWKTSPPAMSLINKHKHTLDKMLYRPYCCCLSFSKLLLLLYFQTLNGLKTHKSTNSSLSVCVCICECFSYHSHNDGIIQFIRILFGCTNNIFIIFPFQYGNIRNGYENY